MEIENKLKELRIKYKTASPSMQQIILRQAKALQIAKAKAKLKQDKLLNQTKIF